VVGKEVFHCNTYLVILSFLAWKRNALHHCMICLTEHNIIKIEEEEEEEEDKKKTINVISSSTLYLLMRRTYSDGLNCDINTT